MELKSMSMIDEENSQILVQKTKYPYNLRLSLDDNQIKALGISEMPALGSKLELDAYVTVVGCSMHEGKKCLELQITDMSLESLEEEAKENEADDKSEAAPKVVEGSKFNESFYGYMGG